MEALFRELVETNKEILNEIRLLRKELAVWQTRSAHPDPGLAQAPAPVQELADQPRTQPQAPTQEPPRPTAQWLEEDVRPASARTTSASKSASLPDPAEFGLPETSKSPPPRYSSQDLEDLRGALLEGVKKRNKQKRDAFAEFDKLHNR